MSNAVALSGAAAFAAGDAAKPIIPATFAAVWEMADLLSISGMTPTGIKTREQVAVALLHGLEVGMTPMASLQSIAVINGRPAIWGDGALALVRSNPLCEGVKEWTENKGTEQEVAYCEVKRKGGEVIRREFTYAEAKAANLLSKDGPWKLYRSRMMQMRARAFALRDGFADVLRGLAIAEEAQDIPVLRDITEAPVPPSAAKPAAERAPAREVQGEIIQPERKPAPAAEQKPAAEAKSAEPEKANAKADDAPLPPQQSEENGNPFDAYLASFSEACDKAPDEAALRALWSGRDQSFGEQGQIAALVEVRDRNKERVGVKPQTQQKPAGPQQATDFNEEAYRSEFLTRLSNAKSAEEALAMNDEAGAHVEAGRLSTAIFEEFYEDPLTTAIERLP